MNKNIIYSLTDNFEDHVHKTSDGVAFWMARDLQHLLGYAEWRNFNLVITKSKTACEVSEQLITDHFIDVNKTIQMPKGAEKLIADIMLTRYACYLIAQNGDPRKEIVNIERRDLPDPSLNEVNYLAFNESNDELIGYIKGEGILNNFKNSKSTMNYTRLFPDGNTKDEQKILSEYIRHQIHHPENTINVRFTNEQLQESIGLMREFIKS
jgi:hypothetical protein